MVKEIERPTCFFNARKFAKTEVIGHLQFYSARELLRLLVMQY